MKLMLDTNSCIDVIKERPRSVLERFASHTVAIGSMDLLIAAHAVSLDVRLITHNVPEFGRVPGLKIEDWA